MTDLTQALAELRQMELTYGQLWTAREVMQTQNADNCKSIATVLNAALSGTMIPRADADLAVARAEKAEQERDRIDQWRETAIVERDTYSEERDAAEAELATLRAQVERLTGALGRAQRALKPFADRVFNDNGDCTISDTHTLTPPDYWNAQSAERIALAALTEGAVP